MSKRTDLSRQHRIFYRIYPSKCVDSDYIQLDTVNNKIYVRHSGELGKECAKKKPNYSEFSNDGIFMDATQELIYDTVEDGVLENVMNGHNAVIMAFGQTGSGKTFTTSGLLRTEEEFGILPRITRDLFNLKIDEPENVKICLQISYVEFYNTYAIDLLQDLPNKMDYRKCKNACKVIVDTEIDALKCIFRAEGRKNCVQSSGSTKAYYSNSATSVATFHIIRKSMDITNPSKVYSKLHIVELVGNDICTTTSNIKEPHKRPKEIGIANITKLHLEQFVLFITRNPLEQKKLVNKRMDSLIYYLAGDFSNESFLRFIGHIKVEKKDISITMSTLKFGNVLQNLHPKKHTVESGINEEVKLTWLQNKLDSMKNKKHLESVLLHQGFEKKLGLQRKLHLNQLVDEFLTDRIDDIAVLNVANHNAVFSRIREVCNNYKNEIKILKEKNEATLAKKLSDTSIKSKSSSTSSQTSGRRLSKKSSSTMSTDNVTSDQKKSRGKNGANERISSTKSSNSALRESANGKRRSSTSSLKIHTSKCSIESLPSDLSLPMLNILPEKQELWKKFSLSPLYEDKVEEYQLNEEEAEISFEDYQSEIIKLGDCHEDVRLRKTDLLLAQNMPDFMKSDDFGSEETLLDAEKLCSERVDEAEELLLEQHDAVQKAKEEFDSYIANREKIVESIELEFHKFCNENYQAPSPTPELEEELLIKSTSYESLEEDQPEVISEQEVIVAIPSAADISKIIPDLQKLIESERKRRQTLLAKKKCEWKNF